MFFSDIKKFITDAKILGNLKKKKIKNITDHSKDVSSSTLFVINNKKFKKTYLKNAIERAKKNQRSNERSIWKIYTKKLRRKDNKRYSANPGLKIKHRNHVLVGVDTSGSVSSEELVEFMHELAHMHKTGNQIIDKRDYFYLIYYNFYYRTLINNLY